MIDRPFMRITQAIGVRLDALNRRFIRWATLLPGRIGVPVAADLARSMPALIGENALLRQHLIVLNRQVARPRPPSLERCAGQESRVAPPLNACGLKVQLMAMVIECCRVASGGNAGRRAQLGSVKERASTFRMSWW